MEKPLIGIVPLYDEDKESYWMLPGYMKGIEAAGGVPVMLALSSDAEVVERLAKTFDGFVFTGGHDIDPARYGEAKADVCGALCPERDRMEAILFERALELDKPAFGICRGLQLFNVLLGGTLYQDLPSQLKADVAVSHKQPHPYDKPAHAVRIEKDTLLHRLLKKDEIRVNTLHHQGIKRLAEPLVAAARAEDGLVESVALPSKRFALAVQWHPEFNFETDENSRALFSAFVHACGR